MVLLSDWVLSLGFGILPPEAQVSGMIDDDQAHSNQHMGRSVIANILDYGCPCRLGPLCLLDFKKFCRCGSGLHDCAANEYPLLGITLSLALES